MGDEWVDGLGTDMDFYNGALRQAQAGSAPIRTGPIFGTTTDVANALTTQVMLSAAIPLRDGDVISKIGVQFGHTAAGTPTNWWFALYSSAATPALLAQTADQTSGAIAADSYKELSLQSNVAITADGLYYVGIMVKATTVPSLLCLVAATTTQHARGKTGIPVLAQTSGSSLTTTAPSTIATPTTVVNYPVGIILS